MRCALVFALYSIALVPHGLSGQAVTGYVAVVEAAERIQNAEITLLDLNGTPTATVFSGDNGEFFLAVQNPGTFVLRIRRIGFKPMSTQVILQTGRTLELHVQMARQATELDGITVYGVTADTPEQLEFLSRRHLPWNYSLSKREIEELRLGNIGEVIDFGVPIKPLGCRIVYLDGRRASLSLIDPTRSEFPLEWIYGLEVYRTYFDIPIRYREPELDNRCGAILLWSTTPPGYESGIGAILSLGFGGGTGWERSVFELAWRAGRADTYVSTARLRIGWFLSERLLGSELARAEGLEPDAQPLFASLYFGKQGPLPVVPWRRVMYTRLAIGMSMYLSQRLRTQPDADSTIVVDPPTAGRFGVGAEVAVGLRYPKGKLRPWLEVKTGSEWVLRVGGRWARPVLMVGFEFGGD